MTTQTDIDAINTKLDAHIQWDVSEHAILRKEHELDYRALIDAINTLRTTMQGEANKIIFVMLGGAVSTIGGVLFFILPHIH